MKKLLLLTVLILFTSLISFSDEITWTGAGGDNLWHNSANWSTGNIPTGDDNVTIPGGSPTCRVHLYTARAGTLNNHGNMEFQGGSHSISDFQNHQDVTISRVGTSYSSVSFNLRNANFENHGTISNGNSHCDLIIEGSQASVTNNGTINVESFSADVEHFETSFASTLRAGNFHRSNDRFNIECSGNFVNNGTIEERSSHYTHGDAPGITIIAQSVTNTGDIFGGNAHYENYDAGSINITANTFVNSERGRIVSGSVAAGIRHAEVSINAQQEINHGYIAAGRSRGKEESEVVNKDIYFGNIFVAADSIMVQGDSARIDADTLTFVFNFLKISDILSFASIYCDELIEFRGTGGAVADLSTNNGSGILFTAGGAIKFYCDSIIPPPLGLNYICSTFPEVYPSDTNYTNGFISKEFITDTAGSDGVLNLLIQNQSAANKSFHYSVSSAKGWISPLNGTTQLLAPFQFDSLMVNYTIPSAADTLIDTITQVLSVPGMFSYTAYSYIQSSFASNPLHHNKIPIPQGWSGISSYIIPVDDNIETIFEPIINELTILKNDSGVYWPAENINTLQTWDSHTGYIIKVSNEIELTITGSAQSNTTVDLFEGWNLIPVLTESNVNVAELFAGLDLIMVKDVAGTGIYWPYHNVNTLEYLTPGKSYFVSMGSSGSITFPTGRENIPFD